jgi:hypothetical protein
MNLSGMSLTNKMFNRSGILDLVVVQFLAGALSLGVKKPRYETEQSLPLNTEVENKYSYSYIQPNAFTVCTDQLYPTPLPYSVYLQMNNYTV